MHFGAGHAPAGAICDACGTEIPQGKGRRFRMKWRHERCLPDTRKAKLRKLRDA